MRVLSVVHDATPTGGGGLFERAVMERGDHLDRWVAAEGDEAPGSVREWDAIMIFGGAMHPDQDAEHPWLEGEIRFVQDALAAEVPLFGVCLGSQLIARAAGAWIGPAAAPEVGWFRVELNEWGVTDPVLGVLPVTVEAFQWHYYTFDLPEGALELASSTVARQAYRLGDRAWGIQFHAEVERDMLAAWFRDGSEELGMPVDEMWAETDRHLHTWNAHGRALCDAFLDEAKHRAA
jgi:GMP synthase-like glutamine amidotransferase